MNGVTTAIVAFIFLALAVPSLIKNKTYFYAALVSILFVILLDAAAKIISLQSFIVFAYSLSALLQIGSILLLVGSTGGLSMGELKNELGNMYEVVRRGETEKEVVIPLSESMKKMQAANARARRNEPEEPKVYMADEPAPQQAAPSPQAPQPPVAKPAIKTPLEKGPLPLE